MSAVAPTMLDFGRIVLNFFSYFLRFYNQNQGFRYQPVDVSLQIVKLSEGLSER
jgi:hypothetical protein